MSNDKDHDDDYEQAMLLTNHHLLIATTVNRVDTNNLLFTQNLQRIQTNKSQHIGNCEAYQSHIKLSENRIVVVVVDMHFDL